MTAPGLRCPRLTVGSRPLTGLFSSEPWFAARLHEYPLAEAAAAEIRPEIKDGAASIEDVLRTRLRDSEDQYAVRRYQQVPLYLQHLLFDVSRTDGGGYTTHPTTTTLSTTQSSRLKT